MRWPACPLTGMLISNVRFSIFLGVNKCVICIGKYDSAAMLAWSARGWRSGGTLGSLALRIFYGMPGECLVHPFHKLIDFPRKYTINVEKTPKIF